MEQISPDAIAIAWQLTRDGEAAWQQGVGDSYIWARGQDGTWILSAFPGDEERQPVRLQFSQAGSQYVTAEAMQGPGAAPAVNDILDTLWETVASQDDENGPEHDTDNIIRAKWAIDGAATLEEAAVKAEAFAERLRGLHAQGWTLAQPVEDDYGFIEKPGWFRALPEELTVETYSALPEEIRREIEVVSGRPVLRAPEGVSRPEAS